MTNQPPPGPTGILVVDKPLRLTSASVVAVVKGRLKAGGAPKRVKVGHAGTLDPLATGVLVVLVGKATRLQERYMQAGKGYTATIDLARRSPTDDLEAECSDVPVDTPPARAHIEQVLAHDFTGHIQQAPPAHSAIKVDGKRAFDLARAGQLDTLPPRTIRIDAIRVLDYAFPNLTIDVQCGKGTYIRSLARDIGTALGTGGVLAALRRTRVGPHHADDAHALEGVPDPLLQQHLIPIDPDPLAGS